MAWRSLHAILAALACGSFVVAAAPAALVNAASLDSTRMVRWAAATYGTTGIRFPTVCGEPAWVQRQGRRIVDRLRTAQSWGATSATVVRRLTELECGLGEHAAAETAAAQFDRDHDASGDPLLMMARGWNAADSGDLPRAVRHWRPVPGVLGLLLGYAEHNLYKGQPKDAERLLAYTQAIDDRCPKALFVQARTMELTGQATEALAVYASADRLSAGADSRAAACDLVPLDLAMAYGRALGVAGRYELAADWLEKAHRLAPDDPQPLVLLGEARWLSRLDATGAEAAFREAIRVDPGHLWSYLGLASLFLTLGRPEPALPLIDLADRYAGPRDRERPLILRGQALLELRRYDEALNVLHRAAAMAPDNGWSFYFTGQVLEAQGDLVRALGAFRQAATLLPGNSGVEAAVAKVAARQSQSRGGQPQRP